MSQDLASLNLTAADLTALRGALATIRTTLGDRTVSLTPEQRRSLVKMGDNTRTFCTQAIDALQANAASLPADFDLAELEQDMADHEALDAFYTEFEQVGELIEDTLKATASDVMTNSILGAAFLKVLNKLRPSLDTLLSELTRVRRRKPAKKQPPTP